MKDKNVGFAFLLLGLIFAVTQETVWWYIGVLLGIIGVLVALKGLKQDK